MINHTNSKVVILIFDYKSFSEQLTLLSDPNRSVQYVTTAGKVEITHHWQFPLFPQCFLPVMFKNSLPFSSNLSIGKRLS